MVNLLHFFLDRRGWRSWVVIPLVSFKRLGVDRPSKPLVGPSQDELLSGL
jgi:hypothetical protein